MGEFSKAIEGLTDGQKRKLRHTLGDFKYDRNGFCSGAFDVPAMEDMVERGLMERGAKTDHGGRYYRATGLGKCAAKRFIQDERDDAGLKPWRVYLSHEWDGREDWQGRRVWAKSRSSARFSVVRDLQDVVDWPVRVLFGYIAKVVRDD